MIRIRYGVPFLLAAWVSAGCAKGVVEQCKAETAASCAYSARCANQSELVVTLCKSQKGTECDALGENRCQLADGGTSGTYDAAKSEACENGYPDATCGSPPQACAEVCKPPSAG